MAYWQKMKMTPRGSNVFYLYIYTLVTRIKIKPLVASDNLNVDETLDFSRPRTFSDREEAVIPLGAIGTFGHCALTSRCDIR